MVINSFINGTANFPQSPALHRHLDPKHRKELEDSGIAPEIIELNFKTLREDEEVRKLLGWKGMANERYTIKGQPGEWEKKREYPATSGEERNEYGGLIKAGVRYTKLVLRRVDNDLHEEKTVALSETTRLNTFTGWACIPLSPWLEEEPSKPWGCFKPDNPRWDGKKQDFRKYENPRSEAGLFLLRVSLERWQAISAKYCAPIAPEDHARGFWAWVWKYGLDIVINEGAKKTACLLSNNIIAIGLPGIWMGRRNPKGDDGKPIGDPFLHPGLAWLADGHCSFTFCFDHDKRRKTRRDVGNAIIKTSELLQEVKCDAKVIDLPGPEKGVEDCSAP